MRRVFGAAVCALVLLLAGCARGAAGEIGGVEITAGLYSLAQYDALKAAEGTDADIAQQTLAGLELYAATELRFNELGGELTSAQLSEAASYAAQLYEQYGSDYKANGITPAALTLWQRAAAKRRALISLVYGPGGETPVAETAVEAYLQNELLRAVYVAVPLYDTASYTPASGQQIAEALRQAGAAAAGYNAAAPATAEKQQASFKVAALAALPGIYAALGGSYTGSESDFSAGLYPRAVLESLFSPSAAAEVFALKNGQAAAVRYSDYAMILLLRLDALSGTGAETQAARDAALYYMKTAELEARLAEYGAKLEHNLNVTL